MRPVIVFIVAFCFVLTSQAASKPNILLIIGDDMGYADISAHGCKDISTPNIDSIAKNGVRCSNGYVSGPYCSPTRAALLTGRYQQRFGHEFNPGPAPRAGADVGLPLTQKTLADRLKAAGYATALVGKWHLGNDRKFNPLSRGFQEFFGFLGGAHSYTNSGADSRNPIMRGFETVDEPEYLTDAFAREALAFIERHQKDPFFLYLAFNAVHAPMHGSPKYLDRFEKISDPKRRTYAAMMTAMDDAIGAVLKKLRDRKLEENTLIFFVSDNGGPPANASDNGKLRGHKASTWEGGIRVPFLFQWKGHLPKGKVYNEPVIQMDFVPTVLAATGLSAESAGNFDGVNLLPYLQGKNSGAPHETLYWRFGEQTAIRMGDWKLVKARERGTNISAKPHLYNLAKDTGEQNDLSDSEPEKLRQLQSAWDKWNAQLVPAAWKPRPNARNPRRIQ